MDLKMHGIIKWYKKYKGYGYIIGDDDETFYFEKINCLNVDDEFKDGDDVLFVPNYEELDYATYVEKVEDNYE